ncbi:MAG: response regulator [Spirochaetaceae bacterium]
MNILIVDDEPKIRKGLRHVVDWFEHGIKIIGSASNGSEALEIIKNPDNKVDLVITDIEMPIMDGIQLSKEIKNSYPGIKIIILSGYDNFEYAKKAMIYGVTDYLLKPVDEDELLNTVLKLRKQIEDKNFSYPEGFVKKIIDDIESFKSKEINDNIEELYLYFKKERYTLKQIKGSLNLMFLNIENKMLPEGVSYKDISNNDEFQTNNLSSSSPEESMTLFLKCLIIIAEHKSSSKSLTIINQIKKYIRENLGSEISLNSVASEFLLNPSYLSQLFKKHYKGGFLTYIIDLKMEKAKKLLKDKNLKISEISEIIGYTDVKYFSKLFKNKIGIRPSEYRENLS